MNALLVAVSLYSIIFAFRRPSLEIRSLESWIRQILINLWNKTVIPKWKRDSKFQSNFQVVSTWNYLENGSCANAYMHAYESFIFIIYIWQTILSLRNHTVMLHKICIHELQSTLPHKIRNPIHSIALF